MNEDKDKTAEQKAKNYSERPCLGDVTCTYGEMKAESYSSFLAGHQSREEEVQILKGDIAWIIRRIRTFVKPENHKYLRLDYFLDNVKDVIDLDIELPKSDLFENNIHLLQSIEEAMSEIKQAKSLISEGSTRVDLAYVSLRNARGTENPLRTDPVMQALSNLVDAIERTSISTTLKLGIEGRFDKEYQKAKQILKGVNNETK